MGHVRPLGSAQHAEQGLTTSQRPPSMALPAGFIAASRTTYCPRHSPGRTGAGAGGGALTGMLFEMLACWHVGQRLSLGVCPCGFHVFCLCLCISHLWESSKMQQMSISMLCMFSARPSMPARSH